MSGLTHLDDTGAARMVDVSGKPVTTRTAIAAGRITMTAQTLAVIRDHSAAKGDVLATARIAGIMAAKRTGGLIPLCHPLPLSAITIDLTPDETGITAIATARTDGKTGVEMEALTAVSVALLTLYDMTKAMDKAMTITDIRLLSKTGGKSGDWIRG